MYVKITDNSITNNLSKGYAISMFGLRRHWSSFDLCMHQFSWSDKKLNLGMKTFNLMVYHYTLNV